MKASANRQRWKDYASPETKVQERFRKELRKDPRPGEFSLAEKKQPGCFYTTKVKMLTSAVTHGPKQFNKVGNIILRICPYQASYCLTAQKSKFLAGEDTKERQRS